MTHQDKEAWLENPWLFWEGNWSSTAPMEWHCLSTTTFVIFLFVWFLLPDCYYKVIGLVKIVWNSWRPKKKLSTLPGMAHCCTSHHPLWHTMRLSWIHMNVRWMSTWTHLVLILTALAYHNTTQALMQLINSKYLSMLSSHELTIILITGNWMKQGAHWQEFTNDLEDWCSCLTGLASSRRNSCASAGFKINYLRQAFPDIPYFFVDMKELGHGMAMDCISKEYVRVPKASFLGPRRNQFFTRPSLGFRPV